MIEADLFRLWKSVAGDEGPEPWNEGSAFGFFQRFRPNGDGLASAIQPLPHGTEVLERLVHVYNATAVGWRRDGAADMYFIVRAPVSSSLTELEHLAQRQMALWAEIALEYGDGDLARELAVTSVEIVPDLPQDPSPPLDTPDVGLYDVEGDWHARLEGIFPAADAVREAFYSIACDYRIARYLTWPWYSAATRIREPFEPYFGLWRRGVEIRVPEPGRVVLGLGRHHPRTDA